MKREETIQTVVSGIDGNRMSSLSQVLRLINSFSSSPDKKDIKSLVEVLGADIAISGRVMRAAQPMRYNPEGIEIETLEQAVHMIGLDRIASVSMSMLAARAMEGDKVDPVIVELLSLSILTGLAAKNISTAAGFRDSDLCFASGLFQNYGDVLLAQFAAEEYRKAVALADLEETSRDQAFESVFGITPGALAREVLERQEMPRALWSSICPGDPDGSAEAGNLSSDQEVQIAASMAHGLGEALNARGVRKDSCQSRISTLVSRYENASGVNAEAFRDIFTALEEDISELKSSGGLPNFANHLKERVRIIARDSDDPFPDPPRVDLSLEDETHEVSDRIESLPKSRVARSKRYFHDGIYHIVNHACELTRTQEDIVCEICKIAVGGYNARNIYFFAPSGYQDYYISFLSYGPDTNRNGSIPNFSLEDQSFLARAIRTREPVIVSGSAAAAEIEPHADWLKGQEHLNPFIAWPLINHDQVIALVLINGGQEYARDEFELSTRPMVQFFRFAALSLATRKASPQLN